MASPQLKWRFVPRFSVTPLPQDCYCCCCLGCALQAAQPPLPEGTVQVPEAAGSPEGSWPAPRPVDVCPLFSHSRMGSPLHLSPGILRAPFWLKRMGSGVVWGKGKGRRTKRDQPEGTGPSWDLLALSFRTALREGLALSSERPERGAEEVLNPFSRGRNMTV